MPTQNPTDQGQNTHDTIVEIVRSALLERSRIGLSKYGVSVADSHLSVPQWLQHAQEEALDLAVYLERVRSGLAEQESLRDKYNQLLFAVTNKHEGETRHETALRYIRQVEQGSSDPKEPKSSPANGVLASA
jgi:hypothetical protein